MRILYVATTRARERLILAASQKRKTCTEIVTNGFYFGGGPLPAWLLGACQSPLDWILYAFSDRKALHEAFQTALAGQCRDDSLFAFTFHGQTELAELSQFVINLKKAKSSPHKEQRTKPGECKAIINSQLSIINESLAWRYRFGDAPSLPAKTSVSELTHRNDEFVRLDYSKALDRRPACLAALEPGRAGALDSRLLGSATHLAIAALDLHRPVTGDAIRTAIEKLAADGALSPTVAAQIDRDSILTFFQGDLGRLALDAENRVHCEWPFTFALPAHELSSPRDQGRGTRDRRREMTDEGPLFAQGQVPGSGSLKRSLGMAAANTLHASRFTSDESIVVQGIIDVLIQTPQGLIVIDFKTDNISAGHATERAELYRGQLDLYARAASAILNTPTAGKWLYFLAPRRAVEISPTFAVRHQNRHF
jgi:ATP-dependent helicase/nuclease subunit A